MSKPTSHQDPFMSIDSSQLSNVSGGAARVTKGGSGSNAELTSMLTSIGDSIKSLAANQGNSGGMDPMMMMMMMMMMGGGGGGSAPAAAPAPSPVPQVNIQTCVKRGC